MMVFDEWQNGMPITFIVIEKIRKCDLDLVLRTLSRQMPSGWMQNTIIMDNAQA